MYRRGGNFLNDGLFRLLQKTCDCSSFDPGALRVEFGAALAVEKCLGHLGAGAVVDADEEDLGFHARPGVCARMIAGASAAPERCAIFTCLKLERAGSHRAADVI